MKRKFDHDDYWIGEANKKSLIDIFGGILAGVLWAFIIYFIVSIYLYFFPC